MIEKEKINEKNKWEERKKLRMNEKEKINENNKCQEIGKK